MQKNSQTTDLQRLKRQKINERNQLINERYTALYAAGFRPSYIMEKLSIQNMLIPAQLYKIIDIPKCKEKAQRLRMGQKN